KQWTASCRRGASIMNTLILEPIPTSNNPYNLTFSIYRPDGQKVSTLKRAFVRTGLINANHKERGFLVDDNDVQYTLICSSELRNSLSYASQTPVIVSFQIHTHGRYAIAKFYVEEKPAKKEDKEKVLCANLEYQDKQISPDGHRKNGQKGKRHY